VRACPTSVLLTESTGKRHFLALLRRELAVARNAGRDRLLHVKEAETKFGVTADWLYRHHKELGFTVRHGRLLRFSELAIEEHIRRRRS
jgi:predicted DNA-binding transcriptional regulator AlpA